jgi:hypothetical protein
MQTKFEGEERVRRGKKHHEKYRTTDVRLIIQGHTSLRLYQLVSSPAPRKKQSQKALSLSLLLSSRWCMHATKTMRKRSMTTCRQAKATLPTLTP